MAEAKELTKRRRDLDSYQQELHELGEPIAEASVAEGAVPMSSPQLNTSLLAIDQLRSQLMDVYHYILRTETDPTIRHQDQNAKKASLKEINKLKEQATALKAAADACLHLSVARREIKGIEKNQEENPNKDFIQAALPINDEMTIIKHHLVAAALEEDHHLWENYERLKQRLVAILSTDVKPPDTKDFRKLHEKEPYKIADLVVPKFDGKIQQWIPFWQEFNQAINKRVGLEDSIKMVYLKQAISDPGLKQTIADLGIEDDAYSAAIELLKDRFDRPRILHRHYCEALKNLPSNNNSRASLNDMADKAQHILTGFTRLKSLGISEAITSMLELLMNHQLKAQWNTHTDERKDTSPAEETIAFIRKKANQATGEESFGSAKHSSEKNKNSKPNRNRGSSTVASASPAVTSAAVSTSNSNTAPKPSKVAVSQPAKSEYAPCKYSCPLCSEKHYAYHCGIFKGYDAAKRNEHAQTHALCQNCLKPGHGSEVCRSTYKCKNCNAKTAMQNTILFCIKTKLVFQVQH